MKTNTILKYPWLEKAAAAIKVEADGTGKANAAKKVTLNSNVYL